MRWNLRLAAAGRGIRAASEQNIRNRAAVGDRAAQVAPPDPRDRQAYLTGAVD